MPLSPNALFCWGKDSLREPGHAFGQQVRQWLEHLEADNYFLRQHAWAQLAQMLGQPANARQVAEEIQQYLRQRPVSLEVRSNLERLRRQFPEAFERVCPNGDSQSLLGRMSLSRTEIEALVAQLDSEAYGERRWAYEQLNRYVEKPGAAPMVVASLQDRLARRPISADLRRWIDPLWEKAWGAWLASGSWGEEILPARPEQLQEWIDRLARCQPPTRMDEVYLVEEAVRQLRLLLARDDQVDWIRQAIEDRLASGGLGPLGKSRLRELADLCRPAMVAEYWHQGQHRGIQHLLVGVPSQVPGAPRPSHFDSINDTTAHCVSGSNLAPGDYPVGVAIPHPHQIDAFFHLVNLPTPRRRMAYEYLTRRDMHQRLAEITQRTCQYYLRRGQSLSSREILVLAYLEPNEVSRFASQFFSRLPDEPIPEAEWDGLVLGSEEAKVLHVGSIEIRGRPSRHGLLCIILAERGTPEAVPGLLEALSKDRLLAPTAESPYAWGWIAALAIAVRAPWPEVDQWLASLLGRTDPLRILLPHEKTMKRVSSDPPQLGATAAWLLLHRCPSAEVPLNILQMVQPVSLPENLLEKKYKISPCRFQEPRASEEILRWWKHRQILRNSAG